MENVESLLSVWMEDQDQCNVPISTMVIHKKAKSLSDDFRKQEVKTATMETFTATCGCLVQET